MSRVCVYSMNAYPLGLLDSLSVTKRTCRQTESETYKPGPKKIKDDISDPDFKTLVKKMYKDDIVISIGEKYNRNT